MELGQSGSCRLKGRAELSGHSPSGHPISPKGLCLIGPRAWQAEACSGEREPRPEGEGRNGGNFAAAASGRRRKIPLPLFPERSDGERGKGRGKNLCVRPFLFS
jgi:hypothetical protein